MGSLRDRGKRLKGKQPTPKPAAKPPLVEERAAPPAGHKPLVVRPPERKRSVTAKPVPAPPTEERAVPAPPTAEELPPAPTNRNEATVPARPVPKVVVSQQGPGTEQLSVSDMEIIGEDAATSMDPVDPVSTPESVTVAARPVPDMDKPPERTARFNAPDDIFNLRIAGLGLRLDEVMDSNTIKVMVLGGKENYAPVLRMGVQVTLSCETSDGKDVNVLLTYKGLSRDGSAREVHCVVEGAVTTLAQTIGRAASKARDMVSEAPSSWRFLSSIVALGAGVAAIAASFTMSGMKALGSFGQYGIAAAGVVAAALGFWSIIERMRYNDNSR